MGVKASEAVKMLEEVINTVGDIEIKVDVGQFLDECRELYLDFKETRTNQFVVLSRHQIDWDYSQANHYYLGNKHSVHPRNLLRR